MCTVLALISITAFGMKKNIKVSSDNGGSLGPWKCATTWCPKTQTSHAITKFKSGKVMTRSTKFCNGGREMLTSTPENVKNACLNAINKKK